ncbi:hypothetical protein J2S74_001121 [Evansella vedderi]|uniref:Uncharacterized protein n=1 Tax=Evansella vedderi TaxID=38282 RepID=A0ABT9ZSA1_9BACI|nr:CBO0543 family protein [Evansella vedderi]MDQ0253749.1 hypothetical protein [Evansella vedderi]
MPSLLDLLTVVSVLTINWDEIIELRTLMRDMLFEYWLRESLFSFNWWFLLVSTIIFFIIWLIVLDKKRIIEISVVGLFIGTIAFVLDTVGVTLVLWSYPYKIIPIVPPILEIHKFHLPIVYMINYQFLNKWKSYLLGTTISAFIFSFIFEPLTVWLGIYEIYHWKYIYSFPIYIAMGVLVRWGMIKVKEMEKKNKKTLPYN